MLSRLYVISGKNIGVPIYDGILKISISKIEIKMHKI